MHTVVLPSGQIFGCPSHLAMSQFSVPTVFGRHETVHFAPFAHSMWQGPPSPHAKWQELFSPQRHVLFEHVPEQLGLFPTQVTWHGDPAHVKLHVLPSPQRH